MNFIKKYKIIIAVILPIVILVLFRTFSLNHFKNDSGKWAEPSVLKSNMISIEQSANLIGDKLLINLDKEGKVDFRVTPKSINIAPESILDKNNIRIIHDHKGPVLLYSSETSVSARIWMLISQMGCTNIYILTMDPDNEVLKHNFRYDTLVKPEV